MVTHKGGRGIKTPYKTKPVRVPVPLVAQISELVSRYDDFIAAGGNPLKPPPLFKANKGNRDPLKPPPLVNPPILRQKTGWIEKYGTKTGKKTHFYYRYCWCEGRKIIHHIHVSGGNVDSEVVQSYISQIKSAMAQGKSPPEIEQMIKSWKT